MPRTRTVELLGSSGVDARGRRTAAWPGMAEATETAIDGSLMQKFESALEAAFEVVPAAVPGLTIDQLDGRLPTGSGPAPWCYTWQAEPVRGSVSPCLAAAIAG